jgi:hypothetical protein
LVLDASPTENRVGEYFTSGFLCLQRKYFAFEYYITFVFHGEELLAPRPTPKLVDHPSSAVRDSLFNVFAAALNIGGRSSIFNLRTRHAEMTDPKDPDIGIYIYVRTTIC